MFSRRFIYSVSIELTHDRLCCNGEKIMLINNKLIDLLNTSCRSVFNKVLIAIL
jgi:hypothetical protein